MFKKATKLLSTMVIVAGTVVGNFSPTMALAEGVVKAGDTEVNDQYGESERRQSS